MSQSLGSRTALIVRCGVKARWIWCVLSALLAVPALIAQSNIEFEFADPSSLRCRVVSAKRVKLKGYEFGQLEVSVRNPTKLHAEPLRFAIERSGRLKKGEAKHSRFERARMPLVGRVGESSIPPGGSRRYTVQTVFQASKKLAVTIELANFHKGAAAPPPERRPTAHSLAAARGTNNFTGKTHDIATFTVSNPLAHSADVWVRATYVRPVKESLLLGYRVRAGEDRRIELGVVGHAQGFDDSERSYAIDVELAKVEVVDWVRIADVSHEDARATFAELYDKWFRWPDTLKRAEAKFQTIEKGEKRLFRGAVKAKLSGRLIVGADRKVSVELEPKSRKQLEKMVRDETDFNWKSDGRLQQFATRYLRRGPIDETCTVKWVTPDSVQVFGGAVEPDRARVREPGESGYSEWAPRFVLDDGRIIRDGSGLRESNDHTWKTKSIGPHWVLARRDYAVDFSTQSRTEEWKFKRGKHGPELVEYSYVTRNEGEVETSQTLKFSEWSFEFAVDPVDASAVATAKEVPVGPGKKDLGDAWGRLYQFSQDKVAWTADVDINTRGTDAVWRGYNAFRAKIKRSRFGNRDEALRFSMGGAASEDVESSLGSLFLARLGMWHGSDPQGMGPFEQAFAGARIGKRNAAGWHDIENHTVARVRVRKGLVREFKLRNGQHRRFHYETFDGVEMITKIERDVARKTEVRIVPARLGEWIVPVRYEFRRIFGEDWGPETFELSNVALVR